MEYKPPPTTETLVLPSDIRAQPSGLSATTAFPPIPGQYGDARFHDALGEVADAAQSAGKAAGILLLDPANLPLVRELGYTVVALGSDGGAVASGLRQSLGKLQSG